MSDSVFHLRFVEHTAAAVNDEGIFAQIVGKFGAGGEFKIELFAGVFPNPVRKLDRADIVALPVVRTSLGNKNRVAVLQLFKLSCTVNELLQIAFIACEKDRE